MTDKDMKWHKTPKKIITRSNSDIYYLVDHMAKHCANQTSKWICAICLEIPHSEYCLLLGTYILIYACNQLAASLFRSFSIVLDYLANSNKWVLFLLALLTVIFLGDRLGSSNLYHLIRSPVSNVQLCAIWLRDNLEFFFIGWSILCHWILLFVSS